jgi:hypothetical protein
MFGEPLAPFSRATSAECVLARTAFQETSEPRNQALGSRQMGGRENAPLLHSAERLAGAINAEMGRSWKLRDLQDASSLATDFPFHLDLHPIKLLPPFFDLPIRGDHFGQQLGRVGLVDVVLHVDEFLSRRIRLLNDAWGI